MRREHSFPGRSAKGDFFGLPGGAYSFATSFAEAMAVKKAAAHKLVERVWLRLGWGPRLVEPVQIRLFIVDPFLDCLIGSVPIS